jgi:hypothetical protein
MIDPDCHLEWIIRRTGEWMEELSDVHTTQTIFIASTGTICCTVCCDLVLWFVIIVLTAGRPLLIRLFQVWGAWEQRRLYNELRYVQEKWAWCDSWAELERRRWSPRKIHEIARDRLLSYLVYNQLDYFVHGHRCWPRGKNQTLKDGTHLTQDDLLSSYLMIRSNLLSQVSVRQRNNFTRSISCRCCAVPILSTL